ncbi:MAG: hypothetical protein M3P51_00005, partial [Chloroflexota bacterium]|nr:hypothetical protein [Chloroflexota bacterium]
EYFHAITGQIDMELLAVSIAQCLSGEAYRRKARRNSGISMTMITTHATIAARALLAGSSLWAST